jgi:hypothetical protein
VATTPLQFMSLLTPQEQGAITAAALQSPPIMLFMLKLAAATYVDVADPQTTGGIAAMVGAGLLTQARGEAITAVLQADKPPLRTVVKSEAIPGNPQIDGRFWVTEVFTLNDGAVSTANVFYDAGTDYEARLAEHAAQMNAQLALAAT